MSGRVFKPTVRLTRRGGPVADAVHGWPHHRARPLRRLLLLIHGFNNDWYDADSSYEAFRRNLVRGLGEGATARSSAIPDVAYFFWPGDGGTFLEKTLHIGKVYARSVRHAKLAAQRLATCLGRLPPASRPDIYLIGHSMGCRLILELLGSHHWWTLRNFPRIRLAALMAGAVPVELVGRRGSLRSGAQRPGLRTTVYHSTYDMVLRVAFPLGQRIAYRRGVEARPYKRAIGLEGAPENFATDQQPMVGYGHGFYWPSPTMARYVATSLGAARPHAILARHHRSPARLALHRLPMREPGPARRRR